MFTFISNLFRKSERAHTPATIRSGSHFTGEAPPIVPTVETAQLSLAAILAKFPDDLKACVLQMPEPAVTVALPVPTILKQLPSCSVKMSLASLYRQAPAGVFKPGPPEDKRMVEVPLPEIFKKVRPELLKRRPDQRPCQMPDDGFGLFGDKENPHAVALTLPEAEPTPPAPVFESEPEAALEVPESAIPEPTAPLMAPAELAASVAPFIAPTSAWMSSGQFAASCPIGRTSGGPSTFGAAGATGAGLGAGAGLETGTAFCAAADGLKLGAGATDAASSAGAINGAVGSGIAGSGTSKTASGSDSNTGAGGGGTTSGSVSATACGFSLSPKSPNPSSGIWHGR